MKNEFVDGKVIASWRAIGIVNLVYAAVLAISFFFGIAHLYGKTVSLFGVFYFFEKMFFIPWNSYIVVELIFSIMYFATFILIVVNLIRYIINFKLGCFDSLSGKRIMTKAILKTIRISRINLVVISVYLLLFVFLFNESLNIILLIMMIAGVLISIASTVLFCISQGNSAKTVIKRSMLDIICSGSLFGVLVTNVSVSNNFVINICDVGHFLFTANFSIDNQSIQERLTIAEVFWDFANNAWCIALCVTAIILLCKYFFPKAAPVNIRKNINFIFFASIGYVLFDIILAVIFYQGFQRTILDILIAEAVDSVPLITFSAAAWLAFYFHLGGYSQIFEDTAETVQQ